MFCDIPKLGCYTNKLALCYGFSVRVVTLAILSAKSF